MGFIPVTPQAQEALVIAQENKVFADALAKGQITQAQYDAAMKAQRARLTDQTVPEGGVKLTAWTKNYQASQAYYQSIGYSQYGGLYPVPSLPEGAKVEKVEEKVTSEGTKTLEFTVSQPAKQASTQTASTQSKGLGEIFFGPNLVDKQMRQIAETQAMKADPVGYTVKKVITIGGTAAMLVNPATAVVGGAISTGFTQGVKAFQGGGLLTPQEATESFMFGSLFSVGSQGVYQGAAKLSPVVLEPTLKGAVVRAGIGAGLGGGASFVISGGDPYATAVGAGLGAGFSATVDIARGINRAYVQPKAAKSLTQSYEAQARLNEKYLYDYGEAAGVWRPTTGQKIVMAVTGAKPKAPAAGIVASGGPAEIIVGGQPQVVGGLSLQQMQAMDAAFDLAVAPRTSGLIISKAPAIPKVVAPKTLPLYFGLGTELFSFQQLKAQEKVLPVEKGLPESTLAYDYQGPLSFSRSGQLQALNVQGKLAFRTWPTVQEIAPTQVAAPSSPMKPFIVNAPTPQQVKESQGVISKVTVPELSKVSAPQVMPVAETQQKQVQNPFLRFRGPAYYQRQIEQEIEETALPVVYPVQSPLAAPPILAKESSVFSIPSYRAGVVPVAGPALAVATTPVLKVGGGPMPEYKLDVTETGMPTFPELPAPKSPYWPNIGGKSMARSVADWPVLKGDYLASVKRKYPIYTPSQLLFGV